MWLELNSKVAPFWLCKTNTSTREHTLKNESYKQMNFPSLLSLTNTYHTMTETNKLSMQFIVTLAYGISPGAFLMSKPLPWKVLNTPTFILHLISVMILPLERQISHMMTGSSVTTWQIRLLKKSLLFS